MPYPNSRGQVAHGKGGGYASLDNEPFHIGGVGGWLDDDTIALANGDDGWLVSAYHVPTKTTRRLFEVACNDVYAGGGHVAGFLASLDDNRGVWSSTGFRNEADPASLKLARDAGLLGMGPDGAIAYKPLYHSNGPTLVRELDGAEWQLTAGHAYQLQMLGQRRAIWWDTITKRVEVAGIARPQLLDGAIFPHAVEMPGGEWWISSFTAAGTILHPFETFEGFPVVPFGTDAWHATARLSEDLILVTWATGEGEQPGQIRKLFFNIRSNVVTDITGHVVASGRRLLTPVIDETLPVLGRALYVGWYVGSPPPGAPGGWGTDVPWATLPGNVRIIIPGGEVRRNDDNTLIGQYVEGVPDTDPDAIDRAVAEAKIRKPGVPIWAYWPRQAQAQSRRPPLGASVVGIELYRGAHETIPAYEARGQASLVGIPKAFLIPQVYTSNTNNTADLKSIVPVVGRLARDNPNVIAIVGFNGSGRKTGLQDHPEVRPLWTTLFDVVPPARSTVTPPRFTISEPTFPLIALLPLARVRCVITMEPNAGEPAWIEWQYSSESKDGPWIVATRNPGDDKDHTFNFTKPGVFWLRAVAGNLAGTHQTGLERRVTVTPAVAEEPTKPTPEPKPVGRENFFQTSNGHFLSARVDEPGTPLKATGKDKGPFERFEITPLGNEPPMAGIRSLQNNKFLRLASGGNLFFDRDTVDDVACTFEFRSGEENRGVSIRASNNRNLTAEGGGGGAVRARDEDTPQSWETFMPSRPVLATSRAQRRTGLVQPDGCALRDDQGSFRPLGLTFMWAMQGWKHERDHFLANAQWAAPFFDYERILTEVGWGDGREIDPTTPRWSDWRTVLREVMDYLYGDLGQRLELTLVGKGTKTDPLWLVRESAAIINENRQHMIVDVECANEYDVGNGISIDMMKVMARELKVLIPNVVALSSPGDWEALKAAAREVGIRGYTVHWDRSFGDFKWRQVRQPYDAHNYKPLVTLANEPAGPGSSVDTQTNPLQLAMTRAVGIMCGAPAFVLHTGTGVFGDGKPHPTAGPRPANFWEIENIEGIIKALRGVETLIPEGVENWTVANTQWTPPNPVAPFQPHHHWEGKEGSGVNKAYSAIANDGRVIQMPLGVREHVALTASYPLTDVVVYDPLSLQPLEGIKTSFDQGEVLDLPGGGDDAMVAYIIHGHR